MRPKSTTPADHITADANQLRTQAPPQQIPSGLVLRCPQERDLWLEGDLRLLRGGPRVAVIGSRTPTPDHIAVAAALTKALSEAGAVVCSGGALGIDGVAHRSALNAGGITALVSPVAPGRVYPRRHEQLFTDVRSLGVVISPFSPDTTFSRSHFRVRNGILARLVDALIVVCADRRSGSLHCARQAWKLGVPVFAVPWTPGSLHAEGTNLLLHAGARAVATPLQASQVVTRLRAAGGSSWLMRDATPPVHIQPPSKPASSEQGRPTSHENVGLSVGAKTPDDSPAIDAGRGRWQRYAPAALRPIGHNEHQAESQLDELKALSAQDKDGAVRLALQQQRDGISLEQLVAETGRTRAELARLLLRWTLTGAARRDPWGRYHDG